MPFAVPHSAKIRSAVRALGDPRSVPDLRWIARFSDAPERTIRKILEEVHESIEVEEQIRAAHRAGGRAFYAQFRAPFDLYALVRLLRPEHVVETGVSSGVSSAHILLGLRQNGSGSLHSIDQPVMQRSRKLDRTESSVSIPPGLTSGWAIPKALTPGWDLRLGTSQEILPRLVQELPSIGLFLHDSLHTSRNLTFELETVRVKLIPDSDVLADNTAWTGSAFDRFAQSLHVPVFRRRRSDLVGLRFPRKSPPLTPSARNGRTSRRRTRRLPGTP
jgi:hypothetical protein